MNPRVALAVNPTAGGGRGARAGAIAAECLTAAGVDVLRLEAAGAADLARLARDAVRSGPDALIVVGGDGMVHLGVNLVAGTPLPLGIVAAGTGNDIARSLRLPVQNPSAAARVVVDALAVPTVRVVDAVHCTGGSPPRWFVGVLGAGFDAIVNERANGWRRPRGRLKYHLAILRELPVFRPRDYVLDLDGEQRTVRAMLVAVANCPAYGGGMRVCPAARLDDGLLDVLVVGPLGRSRFVRLFPRVYAGTHVEHEAVQVLRAACVGIASPGIVGYADGERIAPLPLICRVVPGALRVLAPTSGE